MSQRHSSRLLTPAGPAKAPLFQPLGAKPQSAPVPEENLYSIPAPIAEQNQVAAQRFEPKPVPNQSMQTLEALEAEWR